MSDMDKAVEREKIRADIRLGDAEPPEGFGSGRIPWDGFAWDVKLRYGRRAMSLAFFTGSLAGEPTTADVVGCLVADWSSWVNAQGFEDWAVELGFDPDSRKDEAIYKAVERQSTELEDLLGPDVLERLAQVES